MERSGECAWDRRPALDVNTLVPVTSDAPCDVRGVPRDEQSKHGGLFIQSLER
jgi:hypothetical protein